MLFSTLTVLCLSTFALALPAGEASGAPDWSADHVFEPGSKMPSPESLAACVDTAAQKLGITLDMQTDPKMLSEMINKDLHMKDLMGVHDLFSLQKPVSLRPMLEAVRKGLTVNHPALGVTICAALHDPKTARIFDEGNPEIIKRTLNHMYLLDGLTAKLAEDKEFLKKTYNFLHETTQALSGSKSGMGRAWSFFKAAGMFGAAKDYSVNKGIEGYMKLREAGTVTEEEAKDRAHNLSVNIYEATATDLVHGYTANALVGSRLAWDQAKGVTVEGPNRVIRYGLSLDWARLYETWNFAFITVNVGHSDLLFPKLLIPRVILATGPAYVYERALALWLSVNFFLMANIDKKPDVHVPHNVDLAYLWGKINARYSEYLRLQKPQ